MERAVHDPQHMAVRLLTSLPMLDQAPKKVRSSAQRNSSLDFGAITLGRTSGPCEALTNPANVVTAVW